MNVTRSKNPVYVPPPPDPGGTFCEQSNEIWAVSQAAPMRRVAINGFTTFMDYCGPKAFASGGFVADSRLGVVLNGSQQQWLTRNSKIDFWINGVWNQVFSGVVGAPAEFFTRGNHYTTFATSPLVPENGIVSMDVARAKGMIISGVMFDAGTSSSPVLLQVGSGHARSDTDASDPSGLYDVFFRIGGAALGKASTALVVNSNNVILDDLWAWRADHGTGVGWTAD